MVEIKLIETNIRRSLSSPKGNVFDKLVETIDIYNAREVSTVAALKDRDNKVKKGYLWEVFCREWLIGTCKYTDVWLLRDTPEEVIQYLKLGKRADRGIDIIARSGKGYHAIQCKFRRPDQTVTWTQLSTFVGLVKVSGPWISTRVMTNCKGLSRKVDTGTITMAIGTFRRTTREHWMRIAGTYVENRLGTEPMSESSLVEEEGPTLEELRELRLKRFELSQ